MRIGSLATAAGTTPRTVRHYHRLGLLSEPARRSNGYREYSIDDAIRLMRIRWLADCGMPLGSIASVLGSSTTEDSETDVEADLRALLSGIESEQKKLAHRHSRLSSLLADAEDRRPLTALPRRLADAFADVLSRTHGPERATLRREYELLETMAISGTVPEVFFDALTSTLTDRALSVEYLTLLRRFAALEGMDPAAVRGDVEALAADMAAVIDADSLTAAAGRPEPSTPPLSLEDMVPDAAQRAVVLCVVGHLHVEISA